MSFNTARILARARDAQAAWSALGASRRGAALRRLRCEAPLQSESTAREISKPLDALSGDVLAMLEMMHYYEGRGARILRPNRAGMPAFFFYGAYIKSIASLLRFRHKTTGNAARLNRMLQPLLMGLVLSIALPAEPRAQTHLTVDVRLATSALGELAYLVFESPSGFPDDHEKAIRRGFLPILADAQELHIDIDVPPGTYAVSVYEDLNGNHKLDRNIFGIPREPAGASNNPPARMGPPRFNECSFRLGAAARTISITMVRGS